MLTGLFCALTEHGCGFLDLDALARLLGEAGFVVETQYGGWSGESVTPTSPEIVTLARAAD